MKTSELIGAALDWAVAKCENPQSADEDLVFHVTCDLPLNYSTDWAQGGPLIEREFIDVAGDEFMRGRDDAWLARCDRDGEEHTAPGPTPLIAAMRCYVASQLGDEVDVPVELL